MTTTRQRIFFALSLAIGLVALVALVVDGAHLILLIAFGAGCADYGVRIEERRQHYTRKHCPSCDGFCATKEPE